MDHSRESAHPSTLIHLIWDLGIANSETPMSTLKENLVCAAFNALFFFLMYRVFSAQVELLEGKMKEWREEIRELKRDIRVHMGVVHDGIGVRVGAGKCIGAAERNGAMRDR
ncbi:hypothetical protein J3E73DRAFT_432558 [Bipolaris maydis]|nr:hypothetical protein J3E73DRAFT_432558 [Bipolaris maydis]